MRILGTHVVNQLDAGSGSQRSTGLLDRNIALKLERNALGVRAQHRHAHAGAIHAQLGQMHDFAALVLQFHLLGGKALLLDAANLRNQVARELGGKCARLGNLLATAQGGKLSLELGHTGSASARSCLIRGHDHTLHASKLVQRPRGNQADDGRAVGIGDKAVMPLDVVGIDLGHDQRHFGIHAEGVAVVDHDGAALDGLGQ